MLHRSFAMRFSTLALFMSCLSPFILAQTDTGSVGGRVTDPLGAVIPAATVHLTNADTGLVNLTTTNRDGLYRFSLIRAGNYSITVEAPGMQKAQEQVILEVAQGLQTDIAMKVGTAEAVITVDEQSMRMETESSDLSTTIDSSEVDALPSIGRNPLGLAALSPGVVPLGHFGEGIGGSNNVTPAQQAAYNNDFQANGGSAGYNEILLDGAPITVCCQGQPAYTPSQEIVQQLKIQRSVPPAQFGLTGGAILNTLTKSGANRIHGSASDFIQNTILDAANFFQKRIGYPIPSHADYRNPLHVNVYAATLGGPIVLPHLYDGRNRTFFFFGFQGIDSRNYVSSTTTVPTLLERQGIFTQAPGPIYNPYTTTGIGTSAPQRTAFAGNMIPASMISPVAQAILQYYPLPNSSNAAATVSNYSYVGAVKATDRQYSLRLDHRITDRWNTSLRLTKDNNNTSSYDLNGTYTGPNAVNQNLSSYVFNLDQNYAVTSRLLVDVKYGFAFQENAKLPAALSYNPASLGLPNNFTSVMNPAGFPYMVVSGFAALGYSGNFVWHHYTHFVGVSAITTRGAHSLTFGWDGRLIKTNEFTNYEGQGQFNFTSAFLNGPNPNNAASSGQAAFNAFGAFLLGTPAAGLIDEDARFALSQPYSAFYLQDDWRILKRLTLNLGIRNDYMGGMTERHDKLSTFDPNAANPLAKQTGLSFAGGVASAGTNGNPNAFFKSVEAISPRVGMAFQAASNVAFRGAYGILYLPTSQRYYNSANPAYSVESDMVTTVDGFTPYNTISNPFPQGVLAIPTNANVPVTFSTGNSISGTVYNTPAQYVQQWNAGLQVSLSKTSIFGLTYAASHGVHLLRNLTPNDLAPQFYRSPGSAAVLAQLQGSVANPFYNTVATGTLAQPTVQYVQLTKTYPQYVSVTEQFNPTGSATYNALQAEYRLKAWHDLTATVSYTWSKNLTDVDNLTTGSLGEGVPGYQNTHFMNIERSYAPGDVPNRFTGSAVYTLPIGRGKALFHDANRWVNEVIGGYRVSGIVSLATGLPLQITDSSCPTYAGTRPNLVAGVAEATQGSNYARLGAYLNKSAFTCPVSLQLGNVPRLTSVVRAPGVENVDVSVAKLFPIRELLKLEIRAEAKNTFNRVQFAAPNAIFNTANFGQITGQGNSPRILQVAVRASW